jgi:drug/metabolite transporter (DMT)-like permease
VDPIVFAIIGVAAVIHVAWNVVIKTAAEPLKAGTIGMVAGTAIVVPVAIVGWFVLGRPALTPQAVGLGVVSGLLEAAYFILLAAAYRRGDLSVVYPIARGTAPLLAVLVGVFVLGERVRPGAWLGVGLMLAGILSLQRPWRAVDRVLARRSRPAADGMASSTDDRAADLAVVFAFLTGLTIVGYSAVDRVGARLVPIWLYAAILWPVGAVALVAWTRIVRREQPFPAAGQRTRGAFGGVLTLCAYALILVAYTLAPLAVVAPLRESAIVLASGWGVLGLAEAGDRGEAMRRIAAAFLVLVGAVLLAADA